MRVLSKEELKNEPNGTVYISFTPRIFTGEIHIIPAKNEKENGMENFRFYHFYLKKIQIVI